MYLGQIADERDNPMVQEGIEMCVDMEEMLLNLDETAKIKRASAAVDNTIMSLSTDFNLPENTDTAPDAVMEGF